MRPTLHTAPADAELLRDAGLPWSVLLTPLASVSDDGAETPIVDFGDSGPIRCKRCRVYINPFVAFVEQGRKWTCNFCDMGNEVPPEYFCNLDENGNRRDLADRCELAKGSVEYNVQNSAEYAFVSNAGNAGLSQETYTPTLLPLNYIFCIDISLSAHGLLPSVIEAMRTAIAAAAAQGPQTVSFITYGSTVQFYDFSRTNMPMHVVSDINDMFVPLPFNKVCWLNAASDGDKITQFFEKLPQFARNLQEPNSCVGSALKAAQIILAESGGRVVTFCTSHPKVGMGAIKPREEHKLYGTDNEKQLYAPLEGFWTSLASTCAKTQVCVDLFCFAYTHYCELVTLGHVCHTTGGQQHLFMNFQQQKDYERLNHALTRNMTRACGYAGIIRVRASKGLRVKEYHGHFRSEDPLDMDVAGVDADKTYLVELQHEEKLSADSFVFLQAAMLYTNREGARRIRVHTLRTGVSTTLPNLFRNADLDATVGTLARRTVIKSIKLGMPAAREQLTNANIDILTSYRKNCANNPSAGQLILPEALKLLPVYSLALIKSNTFRQGTDVRVDERVQDMFDILSMPLGQVLPWIYPRLFPLHLMASMAGTVDGSGAVILPTTEGLAVEKINSTGVYLMHDMTSHHIFFWIGDKVNAKIIQYMFNVESSDLINAATLETTASERICNIVRELRRQRQNSRDFLQVIHEKRGSLENLFLQRLVEDKSANGVWSYVEYLCHLHRHIQTRLN